ncbi:hypothetical protein PVAG01_06264 [Phlyctema vagabunda]|uniref:Uncharacterized protein n=1 Tax=Phlyctema vagabunda TaxID=108571 RepID=A0ABR4PFQ1_9HELO
MLSVANQSKLFTRNSLGSLRDLEVRSSSSLLGAESTVGITYSWSWRCGTSARSCTSSTDCRSYLRICQVDSGFRGVR